MSDGRSTSAGFAPPAMRQFGPALAVLGLAGPILADGILAVFVCGLALNGGGRDPIAPPTSPMGTTGHSMSRANQRPGGVV